MRCRVSFLAISLVLVAAVPHDLKAAGESDCPVTKAPASPFIPPTGWSPYNGVDGRFLLGSPGLWVLATTHWTYGTGNKLPYFSQVFPGSDPRLAVVARRLDGSAPLVWATWVNGANTGAPSGGTDFFMTTSLHLPTPGCWEISAHYTPARDKVETVTYTVWADDVGFPRNR